MKKFILAIVAIFTIAISACNKENVAALHKAPIIADKANLAQCDANAPIDPNSPCVPPSGDKGNLGQADGGN
jgi:hypothetical protein